MKAAVGRIVHTVVDPRTNNGEDVAPAIITKVHDDELVNLRVFTDGDANLWLTNVKLVDKRPSADAEPDENAEPELTPAGEPVTTPPTVERLAFWPPRS